MDFTRIILLGTFGLASRKAFVAIDRCPEIVINAVVSQTSPLLVDLAPFPIRISVLLLCEGLESVDAFTQGRAKTFCRCQFNGCEGREDHAK